MPTLQTRKRRNNQRKRGKTRIFFESLEERLPVSASILGAVAGSLFLSENQQETGQNVSSLPEWIQNIETLQDNWNELLENL
ncbi:MAG: hypothetical protein LBJ67_17425 [Planctomycetaceae bacterium]|nr:hypothetical protein [Planctomycetaceae bacterium]